MNDKPKGQLSNRGIKPEEWTDKDGVKHSRIIMVATKFYECPDKEESQKTDE